ncbi:MAG TPA: class I SAM-dependent methyltransferase [Pyrinomonadaceae bacterium]
MLQRFFARQLARPSGLFGRLVTARWLDKSSATMNQLTFERLSLQPDDRVLEVGFGSGYLLKKILSAGPCAHVAGIDPSADMVRLVERRLGKFIRGGKARIREGSIEALPFGDGEFTKLCTVNTLYFWQEPAVPLSECRRVLREDGLLVLCFNAKEDLERWPGHKYGFRLYELSEIEEELTRSGFGAIDVARGHDPAQGLFYCVNAKAV